MEINEFKMIQKMIFQFYRFRCRIWINILAMLVLNNLVLNNLSKTQKIRVNIKQIMMNNKMKKNNF